MNPVELAKYVQAIQKILALLKANNITLAQATAVAQGAEPILAEVGVSVPPYVQEALTLLGLLETPAA